MARQGDIDRFNRLMALAEKVPYIPGKPKLETIAFAEGIVQGITPLFEGLKPDEIIAALIIGIASGVMADPHYPTKTTVGEGMYTLACVIAAAIRLHDKPLLVT